MKPNLIRQEEKYWGNLSGIRGDLDGIRGDLDDCEITESERGRGIKIIDLIATSTTSKQ